MKRWWLWLMLAALPARAQMTQVSALVQDANGQRYVNCTWSVVFVGLNNVPGAGPYQPAALLVGQQGFCDSSGNLNVSLADNVNTVRPTPSQWKFSICSAPGYVPGGTYCRNNMQVTITGQTQNLTAFFQPLMPLLPTGGGGGGGTGGTSVTVNGTAAVPNTLNFNSNAPLPPAGSTIVQWLLNGNNVLGYITGGGGGGGGSLTVNGGTGGTDLNDRLPPFPPNGINISWQASGGHISGAIVGDGIATHCFLGTGVFAVCPGGGGGGGGATLPTTPVMDLFASTGLGGAQASGIGGKSGFLQAQVITAIGDSTNSPSPFGQPNASVEYFPQGAYGAGGANGLAAYFSHSGISSPNDTTGNGGVALAGGNASGLHYQIYLDCERTGCDFKVPPTLNGNPIGGGGGGTLPTIPQWNLFASTGSGAATDSGVAAESGFMRAQVLESTGAPGGAPSGFAPPNGSIEYFPTGAYGIGGANGLAIHFSHSSITNGTAPGYGNGGIALGGGNATGYPNNPYQIYLDCESSPLGCDFKVPVTQNGTAIGGGGSGTVASGTVGHFTWHTAATTVSSNANLDDGVTTAGTITSQEPIAAPQVNLSGTGGIAMTGPGGTLPTVATGSGGIGIGPGGIPQINPNGTGWVNIPTSTSGGAVAWGSITGTMSSQADLQTALNAKLGLASTLSPTLCSGGQAAAGILANGNATGCFTPAGGGGGGGAGSPNQSVSFTNTTTASLTVTSSTTALVWACWDGPIFPANAIYPSNVSVSSAYLVTFTFAVQQSGYCVVNSAGGTGIQPVTFTAATTATVTANVATPVWSCWDTATPANAIYPSNVSVDPTTYLVTFTFAVPQTGQCAVTSSSGSAGGGAGTNTITCAPAADLLTFTARTNVCILNLPAQASAKQWIVVCNLIWNMQTGGSGATTITSRLNLNNAPSSMSYFTAQTWANAGPTYGAVNVLAAAGDTLFNSTATNNTDLTIWSYEYRGTIMAPAAGETAIFSLQSSNGTGAIRLGSYCTAQ